MLSRRSWRKSAAKKMVAGPERIRLSLGPHYLRNERRAFVVDDVNDDGGTDDRLGTSHPKEREKFT